MPFSAHQAVNGLLVPALAGLLLTVMAALSSRGAGLLRLACPLAMVAGYLLSYWLLNLDPFVPTAHRHWVPYAALLALVPAAAPATTLRALAVKWLSALAAIILAAALLVPSWPHLQPSRPVYLVAWSAFTSLVALAMLWIAHRRRLSGEELELDSDPQPAPRRAMSGGMPWLAMMIASLACSAALLALGGNLRFGQGAAAAMAALTGVAAGLLITGRRPGLDGVALVYTLFICAALLTGKVNSFSGIPLASYLLVPLMPLALAAAPGGSARGLRFSQVAPAALLAIALGGVAMGLAVAATGISEY